MPWKEKEIEKLYYSIGEVADMLSVPTSMIRFWLLALDVEIRKDRRGNRQFMMEDIQTVKQIYHLVKVEEYTLSGAKRQMRMNRQ